MVFAIINNDLFISHIKNLLEDFKARFKDLLNMEIHEWIISPFDVEVKSVNSDNLLKEEFIEMTFYLEPKFMYTFKGIGNYWIHEKSVAEHSKFCATVEVILLVFPS